MNFFDRLGRQVAYLQGIVIFKFDGTPVAYLRDDCVYAYGGRMLGWLDKGWLLDRQNRHALFSRDPVDGPPRPSIHETEPAPPSGPEPRRAPPEPPRPRKYGELTWSRVSGPHYFGQ